MRFAQPKRAGVKRAEKQEIRKTRQKAVRIQSEKYSKNSPAGITNDEGGRRDDDSGKDLFCSGGVYPTSSLCKLVF